jgi:hypothetical protein
MRGLLRWAAAAIFVSAASLLLEENGRNYIEEHHWQKLWAKGAAVMPDLSSLMESSWFWALLWTSGGFAAGLWLDALLRRRDERQGTQSPIFKPHDQNLTAPSGYIWLRRAAETLYGKLGKCDLRDRIDRVGKSDDAIVDVIARMIANFADIYGCRGPSNILSKIDHEDIEALEFSNWASSMNSPDPGSKRVWNGLLVKPEDFDRATTAILNARHGSALQIR